VTVRALYFDFGGVLVRTEDPAPRARLAEALGLSSREIERLVFESASAERAMVGEIPEEQHWQVLARTLKLPESEIPHLHEEFFIGDRWDSALFDFLRRQRKKVRTGLISNAWSGLRSVIVNEKFDDAFDAMIISAEVGVAKPDAAIYRLALEKLGVEPQEAVFVDDVLVNVEAAQAVGMHAIQFTRTEAVLAELKPLLANHR
jgi:epoxide hydrolase-like predicted phosphatase